MTATECARQALAQAHVSGENRGRAEDATAKWMAPYIAREAVVHDGSAQVFVTDPETREQVLKEIQLHPGRPVVPFVFGPGEVKSLANHIRRELRLA